MRPPEDLDPIALERIRARVGAEGPTLVERAWRVHRVKKATTLAAGVAIAAAGIALLLRAPAPSASEPIAARACERFDVKGEVAERASENGARTFDLGALAVAVAAPNADVQIAERTPCRTVFELRAGRITIFARELGGGTLAVRSLEDEVVVQGTVFAVERAGPQLVVAVAEGRVEVGRGVSVEAGQRIEKRGASVARTDLAARERDTLLATVGIEREASPEPAAAPTPEARRPRPTAPERGPPIAPPTADDLVRRANTARRDGDLTSARRLFTEAGQKDGATAEAAWIALARLELADGRADAAVTALDAHARRFDQGALAVEAAWVRLRALEAAGRAEAAKKQAESIVRRWPNSEQAISARAWLERTR